MPDLSGAGEGALLNYLAGTTDAGEGRALTDIASARLMPEVPVGSYYSTNGGNQSTNTPRAVGETHFSQFVMPQAMTVDSVSFAVGVAHDNASFQMRLGLWTSSNGYAPTDLLLDCGVFAIGTSTGLFTATGLDLTFTEAGIYWVSISTQVAAPTAGSLRGSVASPPLVTLAAKTELGAAGVVGTGITGALPSTPPTLTANTGTNPPPILEFHRSA